MILYEDYLPLLPHEYSYALYLSYEFDLCMYDLMIINMVSERYPRDEDYASDADSNSDSVTIEDSDFGDSECYVPAWLFLEREEEEASLLGHDNNNLKIVFGSISEESNLGTAFATPPFPIRPEFDGFTINIGEISCYLNAVKHGDKDEGSGDVVCMFVDLESNAVDLESNTDGEKHLQGQHRELNFHSYFQEKFIAMEFEQNANSDTAVTPAVSHLDMTLLYVNDLSHEINDSQLYDSFNQIGQASLVRGCSGLVIQQSLGSSYVNFSNPRDVAKALDVLDLTPQFHKSIIRKSDVSLSTRTIASDSEKFLRYGADPFRSPSLFNQIFMILVAADDFVYAKSIPDLSVLEEVVKEIYLEDPKCEVPYDVKWFLFHIYREFIDVPFSIVGKEEEITPPWKKREENKLFVDLWILDFSPEPPWELHLRREASRLFLRLAVYKFSVFLGHTLGLISLIGDAWAASMLWARKYPP